MKKTFTNYTLSFVSISIGIVLGFSPVGKLKLFPIIVGSLIGIKVLRR